MATTGVDPAPTPTGGEAVDPVPSTGGGAPPNPPRPSAIAPSPVATPSPPSPGAAGPPSSPPHRRAHLSIRARVVATFAILLVVALVVATGAIGRVLHQQYDQRIDEELVRTVEGIRRQVAPDASSATSGDATLRDAIAAHLETLAPRSDEGVLAILDGKAALTTSWSSTRLDDLDAVAVWSTLTTSRTGEIETPAGPARFVATPIANSSGTLGQIVVVRFVGVERAQLDDTIQTVALILLIILGAAILVAWGSAGRALRPVHRLAGTVREVVDLGTLGTRVDADGHDEVADLGRAFNEMLDHLEGAFASQQEFIDGVGHDLRTPITIVRGHLELLDDDPVERRRTVKLVLDELDRMDRLVEDLRLIARAQRPDFLRLEYVQIGDLTRDLVANASALAPRDWRLGQVDGAVLVADPDRLVEALVNIIENAVHVTQEGDVIEISCVVEAGSARISVADSGPGISDAEREQIFLPSVRGRHNEPGGTGLGLAIAMSIAQAHGGTIVLESSARGATFGLCVPSPGEPRLVRQAGGAQGAGQGTAP